MSWREVGDVGFYAATAVAIAFSLLYLIFAPWWKTETGRNIMAVMGSMAITFGYFAWVISLGHLPAGFMPVRAILFNAVAVSIVWRTVMLIRSHIIPSLRRTGKERKDELEDSR